MAKQKFTTNFDSDILKLIKKQAIDEDCSIAELIERVMVEYIKSRKEKSE